VLTRGGGLEGGRVEKGGGEVEGVVESEERGVVGSKGREDGVSAVVVVRVESTVMSVLSFV